MGNRETTSSPRHKIPRNLANEEKARQHYQTRADRRPKQKFVWDNSITGHWEKQ